jgi:stage II sporulation protein D
MIILSGIKLRSILAGRKIKSTWFWIQDDASQGMLTFTGKGFGHGVGLCQNGTKGMAQAGYTFKDILIHYYTGISFLRIY